MKKSIVRGTRQELTRMNLSHFFLFFLLIVSIIACYLMLQPYLNAIILALLLSTLLHPVNEKIEQWVKGRKNLAALLSCVLLVLVVVLPLMFMTIALIQQGFQAGTAIYNWVASGKYNDLLDHPWSQRFITLGDKYLPEIQKLFPDLDLETMRLDKTLLNLSSWLTANLLSQGRSFFGNFAAIIVQFFLMIFAFFFIIRDREKIFKGILHLIPLSSSHERKIIDKVTAVSRSVLLGTLVTALAQGTAGGIAFHIAGLPGLFWGAVMAFTSLIPVIGTWLIWVPAAIFLFLSGRWGYGIFMVLWCGILVSSIDNFIRPMFMKESGGGGSMLLIFFSILGGLHLFGFIGLLYGPLIVGLTLVLLYIYSLEFKTFLTYLDKS
jgi:predicted PurR-regulated permease PerM